MFSTFQGTFQGQAGGQPGLRREPEQYSQARWSFIPRRGQREPNECGYKPVVSPPIYPGSKRYAWQVHPV